MQFEVIRKIHKKEILIGVIVIILIAVVLLVRNSFAKYQTTKNMKIAEGTINYTVPDFKIMGIYYQKEEETCTEDNCYEEKESMPELGYEINTMKSYCELNGNKDNNAEIYTDENDQHVIAKFTKGDRCYLYFDKQTTKNVNTPLGIIKVNLESPDSFTGPATGNEGMFKAQDNDGDTYYFRGAVTNNYVNFAGYFWRIIRINGDGTIRMIYDGTSARANGTPSEYTQIGKSAFNSSRDSNMYVGFQYGSGVHGTGTESDILKTLNTWYTNNLTSYADKIDINAGFCNDREPSTTMGTSNGQGGTGTTTTYYGAFIRILNSSGYWNSIQTPTFKCKDSRDLFTKSGATKKDGTANGNRSLKYPIGLITADEVVYAGGFGGTANSSYYLYTGQIYWTLSPYWWHGSYGPAAYVFPVDSDGTLGNWNVANTGGVRPVINLKADTKFTYKDATTKGTMGDPYVVE